MPNEIINQRIEELEPTYRDYILSDEINDIAAEFSEAHGLDEDQATSLETGIFLFLLFFINKDSFTGFIVENCNLEDESAGILTEAILMIIPANIREMHQKTTELVFDDEVPSVDNQDISQDIAETEAVIGSLPPLRTMKEDSRHQWAGEPEEIIHTSSQETLLQEPSPSVTPPTSLK